MIGLTTGMSKFQRAKPYVTMLRTLELKIEERAQRPRRYNVREVCELAVSEGRSLDIVTKMDPS